jgi:uncharacterized protein (TIGR00369 family)
MPRMTADEIAAFLDQVFPEARTFSTIVDVGERELTARLPFSPAYLRPGGTLSGPTLMTLADTTAYFLILAMRGPLALAVTSSLDIHFLAKPPPADVLATATMVKLGRRLAVTSVDLRTIDAPPHELLARATVTYALPEST